MDGKWSSHSQKFTDLPGHQHCLFRKNRLSDYKITLLKSYSPSFLLQKKKNKFWTQNISWKFILSSSARFSTRYGRSREWIKIESSERYARASFFLPESIGCLLTSRWGGRHYFESRARLHPCGFINPTARNENLCPVRGAGARSACKPVSHGTGKSILACGFA